MNENKFSFDKKKINTYMSCVEMDSHHFPKTKKGTCCIFYIHEKDGKCFPSKLEIQRHDRKKTGKNKVQGNRVGWKHRRLEMGRFGSISDLEPGSLLLRR